MKGHTSSMGLVSSQQQGPLNPKECFCHSSTLSQSRIEVWKHHLGEAVTKGVTTVVVQVIDVEFSVSVTKENLTGFSLLFIA